MEDQQTGAEADSHAECQQQLADVEARWKRARADYENREKEIARERAEFAQFCTVGLIRDFLPIMDAMIAARPHPPTPSLPEGGGEMQKEDSFLGGGEETKKNFSPSRGEGELEGVGQGLEALQRLCADLLKRHGVEPVGAIGDRVDYLLHEVVGTKTVSDTVSGTILEVMQLGYTMHGRLLRPAKVIVCTEKNELPPAHDHPEEPKATKDPTAT